MDSSPRIFEWTALISGGTGDGSGAFLSFPWDLKGSFGKGNLVPICCEFDGIPYRGQLANMGSGPCLVLLKEIRAKLGKKAGDTVQVRLWLDTEPRIIEPTDDLRSLLAANPEAQARWDKFSPSHRKEYVLWIESAKKPETRAVRVAKSVVLIAQGKKLK